MTMTIKDSDELTDIIKIQLSSLSPLITEEGYEVVCEQTMQELGWTFPVTNPTQLLWLVKRAARNATYILLIASANKFKYKLVNLQHRFEHFKALVDMMDKEFEEAMAANPAFFAVIGSAGENAYTLFGIKIDAGFAYNFAGEDVTYDVRRYVNATPTEA